MKRERARYGEIVCKAINKEGNCREAATFCRSSTVFSCGILASSPAAVTERHEEHRGAS